MNCSISSGGSHVAPKRTSISEADRSLGCTFSNAAIFTVYWGSSIPFNSCSFLRTSPERYSSAVSYCFVVGLRKITPVSSSASCSSVLPISCAIYGISILAFSAIDTARASDAVSTDVITLCWRMVRFVNMSALRSRLPFSSMTSREHNKQ